jgi:hypothetical protein
MNFSMIATLVQIWAVSLVSSEGDGGGFDAWADAYGKRYAGPGERAMREAVWTANQALVTQHNAEVHTYRLGMNAYADMGNDEFTALFRGGYGGSPSPAAAPSALLGTLIPTRLPGPPSLPASVNWWIEGISTGVKNQGSCASCWSFAAVAAMESAYNRQHLQSATPVDAACNATCGPRQDRCCTFSEQEGVDCAKGGADTCATGGEPYDAFSEIVHNHGGKINTEQQYPYSSGAGGSPGTCKADDAAAVSINITGYFNITSAAQKLVAPFGNESNLQYAVAQQGVVAVGIDSTGPNFQLYASGVYSNPKCGQAQWQLDHAVSVIGFGTTADGKEYYVVKNSWGSGWGNQGYIYMSRNADNQCGIATDASIPVLAPLPPTPPTPPTPAPAPPAKCSVAESNKKRCCKRVKEPTKKVCDGKPECCWKVNSISPELSCYLQNPF